MNLQDQLQAYETQFKQDIRRILNNAKTAAWKCFDQTYPWFKTAHQAIATTRMAVWEKIGHPVMPRDIQDINGYFADVNAVDAWRKSIVTIEWGAFDELKEFAWLIASVGESCNRFIKEMELLDN